MMNLFLSKSDFTADWVGREGSAKGWDFKSQKKQIRMDGGVQDPMLKIE